MCSPARRFVSVSFVKLNVDHVIDGHRRRVALRSPCLLVEIPSLGAVYCPPL